MYSAFQSIHAVILLGKNCHTCDCVLYISQAGIWCCSYLRFPVQMSSAGKLLLTVNFTCLARGWKELTTVTSVPWCVSLVGWGGWQQARASRCGPHWGSRGGGCVLWEEGRSIILVLPRCRSVPGTWFHLQVWAAESRRTCGTGSACRGLPCGVSALQMAQIPSLGNRHLDFVGCCVLTW